MKLFNKSTSKAKLFNKLGQSNKLFNKMSYSSPSMSSNNSNDLHRFSLVLKTCLLLTFLFNFIFLIIDNKKSNFNRWE